MSTSGHRSLADQLRAWPDERLAGLLSLRPDLVSPAPHDSGQLASRAATRSSLQRALDQLSRLELYVLDALVVAGHTDPDEVVGLVRAAPEAVRTALGRLLDAALVWEGTSGLRVLTGVSEVHVGGPEAGVSGLRPRSTDPLPAAEVERRVAEVSEQARTMLHAVLDAGGEATSGSSRHTVSPADARTPAEELLSRRLLVRRTDGVVVLPGEVGLVLRGGRTTTEPVDEVPVVPTSSRGADMVARAASGAAFEAVRRVELLLETWGTHPPSALRSGGLGVRDLKAATTLLGLDEAGTALLVETAAAAGLLAQGLGRESEPAWEPTDDYDRWLGLGLAARWRVLVRAWLTSPRMPALVGRKDPAGKTWNALVPELVGAHQVETRRLTLDALASLDPDAVPASGTGLPGVVARVSWLRPRRPRNRAEQVAWAVEEAAVLGMTGLGGLPDYARTLLAGDEDAAVAALDALLPDPVEQVLLQADLTAVAPGPLTSALARRLASVADVESRGGATVYRFTPTSVRRSLDLGWTAAELHDFLGTVSATPVPQPLSYLVDDTARTFGSVRVGAAEAFLRSDDETALAELLHHPRAQTLGLRRIAPTVLVTATPIDVLLPRLRELGAAPVVEGPDGEVRVAAPDQLRARVPRERRAGAAAASRAARAEASVAHVVSAVRSGDRAAASRAEPGAPVSPADALSALREAIEARRTVVIGYVDQQGRRGDRVVDPLRLDGGVLTGFDHRADDEMRFAVHRVHSVRLAD
ncbi:helicase C-terminal domain-containing protein [Nocardioides bruguierae]|uniref:Helicase C-terminal domain-containing protein n=1 Tax=Nocardioides bruguierae TaxID=2945102 RepID=A0A9X2D5T2_9ACTN|nr:helicase C-terminal domain-containing protein [Nocardioides bruguierae]MCM0619873.1 helicase C-terminal domain-containing protein [Nocardioides bruguierae]